MQGHAARPTEIPFAILHTSHGVMIITHAARAGGVGVAARRLVRRQQQQQQSDNATFVKKAISCENLAYLAS